MFEEESEREGGCRRKAKEELQEEVKELKKSKDRWELQIEKLQDHFIETNKTGNDFNTLRSVLDLTSLTTPYHFYNFSVLPSMNQSHAAILNTAYGRVIAGLSISSQTITNTQNTMASVDRVERELEDVKTEYRRCVEELKEFRKGEKGDRLEELKRNLRVKKWTDTDEKEAWIEEKEDLEKQEKKLEASKDRWELQMEKLQDHFIETNKTGNDFVT
ncbi:hypothetical protein G9A89_005245 [Geosiphon pyriformis]|nr:hypothetical protein G9A89_005245 [Geosiphon pyriformis]